MLVPASLLIDLGLAVGIRNNNTGINFFFLFSIWLQRLIFSLETALDSGDNGYLDRLWDSMKETGTDQKWTGDFSAQFVWLISEKHSKNQNSTYNAGVCIAFFFPFTKNVIHLHIKGYLIKKTRIKWVRSLKPRAFWVRLKPGDTNPQCSNPRKQSLTSRRI